MIYKYIVSFILLIISFAVQKIFFDAFPLVY